MVKIKRKKQKKAHSVRHSVSNKKVPKTVYQINHTLPFFNELRNLILKIAPPSFPALEKNLKRIGRIKLAVVTGTFLNLNDTRVDILVVGDDIEPKRFNDFIKKLESNIGLELRYVVLGTEEFLYRYNMLDRFVHDILEYPHKKLINRVNYLK